jgi:putative hydrolase of the HAD superfamily
VSAPRAVISDFGGVLTEPLWLAFAAANEQAGISLEAAGKAVARLIRRDGRNPLFELERGAMPVDDFLSALERELAAETGRELHLGDFAERYFERLAPNEEMLALMRELRAAGMRMAICTNNVREWEALWRAKLPVDELFEVVVDSAFVGMRKPEPEIFELTADRLGVRPEECVFVDDVEVNCQAAAALGMRAVWFRSNDQAIPEIRAQFSQPRRSQQ